MERDGNQQIHRVVPAEALKDRVQQIAKDAHEREYTAVFESMDRLF
jgi:hypothetical protein